ncbi:hypothetical protein F5B22DRAFT_646251 [Xylaria bambusicola]|uniref:uncharacterized protein n=1 Tax=Xylaria bambusicola TaxID=326684 RepID=UPI0020072F89|nr:uncharacterized protein F5B22DRAFT_646251 [Xylaria bambusicola]KAI0516904.1 hypothetical protein F5B22DRAFT_646251 [Xylaria bambusicola]
MVERKAIGGVMPKSGRSADENDTSENEIITNLGYYDLLSPSCQDSTANSHLVFIETSMELTNTHPLITLNMRAAALSLLSAVGLASAQVQNATIVVEKSLGNAYQNTTISFSPVYDYENPEILNQVSSLYQIGPEYTYFCFATRPDGTKYSDEWFGIGKPLRLSTNNVVVKTISCYLE